MKRETIIALVGFAGLAMALPHFVKGANPHGAYTSQQGTRHSTSGKSLTWPRSMNETVHRVHVTVPMRDWSKRSGRMIVTAYKPDGAGPFPAIIHHHGTDPTRRHKRRRFRQFHYARHWVRRGFAVFAVTRLGFGDAGPEPFPERIAGTCDNPDFDPVYAALAEQSAAALGFVKSQAYVDASRIILSGQSMGGSAVLAHLSRGAPGVVGGLNFASGLSDTPIGRRTIECGWDRMPSIYRSFGRGANAPSLWIYGEGDSYSPLKIAKARFKQYQLTGGRAKLHVVPKQSGLDGHFVIIRPYLWMREADEFVRNAGIEIRHAKRRR
ncbi:MAG: hypothetical protein K0U74_09225 [Alphaproteobacteria bacterium]|nr:hypothetical protein [Alphaproteobacteria bacterium]